MNKFFIFSILIVGLSACSQPELPIDHFYRLEVAVPEKAFSSPVIDGVVEVGQFSAYGITARRSIVYSVEGKPLELRDYHYHLWTAPPPIMLRDLLVEYLRSSGAVETVVTPEMRILPDYVLAAKIKRLEQITGTPSMVAVELEFMLRKTDGKKPIFFNTYKVKINAASGTVPSAIESVNLAIDQIYARFINDLAKLEQ